MIEILAVDSVSPQRGAIEAAVRVLAAGGLVIFPTRCLYGLGADATRPQAVERVFAAKGRPPDNPISVLCGDAGVLQRVVRKVTPLGERIMRRYWPGAVTLVFEAAADLPATLTAGTGRIGVRLPAHPVAAALAARFGRPLTATSANRSGERGASRVADLPPPLLERVDLVLDAGALEGGNGSTVVDVTGDVPVVLREGVVSAAALEKCCGRQG